jgi:hypothetical protein
MPEAVVRWCAHCWARWGGIGGGNFYILGVAGFITPIWDVLAPQGEQERALNHLRMCSRSLAFPIRQVVPVGIARIQFCCWARWARFIIEKICITVDTTHLHASHPFLWLKGGRNGWMAADELG